MACSWGPVKVFRTASGMEAMIFSEKGSASYFAIINQNPLQTGAPAV